MFKTIEKYFLIKFGSTDFMTRQRAKVLLYFQLITVTILCVTTPVLIRLSVYEPFSMEALTRLLIISLGIVGLPSLRNGRYDIASNFLIIGGTCIIGLQVILGDNSTPFAMYLSLSILYMFIIASALFCQTIVTSFTAFLTIVIAVITVFNSDILTPEISKRMLGSFIVITVFITLLSQLLLKIVNATLKKLDENLKKEEQQSVLIKNLLISVQSTSIQLAESTNELAITSGTFAGNSQNQASTAEEMTAIVEEISASIESIAGGADSSGKLMQNLINKMNEYSSIVKDLKNMIIDLLNKTQIISEHTRTGEKNLNKMGESMVNIKNGADEMKNIVQIINDISDQINLLSLNASIEAARAGDAGRGFAVVADEIGKLADKTTQSVNDIRSLIKSNVAEIAKGEENADITVKTISMILTDISSNYAVMKKISSRMDMQLAANDIINQDTQQVKIMSDNIMNAIKEQKIASSEIIKAISTINESTQSIASGAEEMTGSTEMLAALAENLKIMVNSVSVASDSDNTAHK